MTREAARLMRRLTPAELDDELALLPGWTRSPEEDGGIEYWHTAPDFAGAMGFVGDVAAVAEAANHHPDLDIRYNRVRVFLTTHDAGGVTDRDIALARGIMHLLTDE
jgi:4a-hydroxytetrahydrobiopterin dehydratase